ncbi:3-methyladenine DNA glycosylase AlkD [Arthrobacter alpinus]|uniref:3-methyladenine DNA glycosylase AlkD n=1 Tax=Arthrobacter alpinus TaxID=656366 RepID=A0A1H5FTJ3_9MICC|nr:DNA alkylation repair protein [Arthrobacter alpinus]SEE06474.1 3-methyladenine DNA glycosylase AlkD [Arthrobacter alpinus]
MTPSDTDLLLEYVPTGLTNAAFLQALRPALDQVSLTEKAEGMALYMKSSMPYLGVPSPAVRKTVRALAKEHPFANVEELHATVMALWTAAQFREERYAAIMLTDSRLGKGEMGLLPFYGVVIGTGQWWDFVDSVAPRLCELLQMHRDTMDPLLRQWSVHENFWFRRASIIAQLPAKAATDLNLLSGVIGPNLDDKEFFIRKAIGWALRQHGKTDPEWVRSYVQEHAAQLSPLSRREALKHL